jgi:Protein of unknown function (DUF 659)
MRARNNKVKEKGAVKRKREEIAKHIVIDDEDEEVEEGEEEELELSGPSVRDVPESSTQRHDTTPVRIPLKQQTIQKCMKKADKSRLDASWARAIYAAGIPFNAMENPLVVAAIRETNNAIASNYGGPSRRAVGGNLLDKEKKRVDLSLAVYREGLLTTGCTISSDGWSDITSKPLVNIICNTPKGDMFLEAVDASGQYKNAEYLAACIEKGILNVGVENVIQVITDSAPVCKMATDIIKKRYKKIWAAPCATHCIDLIFKDFGKVFWVAKATKTAFEVIKFITNHQQSYFQFKQLSKLNLKKPVATRFATNFIMVQRIVEVKDEITTLVLSKEWKDWLNSRESSASVKSEAEETKMTVIDSSFWESLRCVLAIGHKLMQVLRATDSGQPYMGNLWVKMWEVGADLEKLRLGEVKGFQGVVLSDSDVDDLLQIFRNRWDFTLHTDLHSAGYMFNPQ